MISITFRSFIFLLNIYFNQKYISIYIQKNNKNIFFEYFKFYIMVELMLISTHMFFDNFKTTKIKILQKISLDFIDHHKPMNLSAFNKLDKTLLYGWLAIKRIIYLQIFFVIAGYISNLIININLPKVRYNISMTILFSHFLWITHIICHFVNHHPKTPKILRNLLFIFLHPNIHRNHHTNKTPTDFGFTNWVFFIRF